MKKRRFCRWKCGGRSETDGEGGSFPVRGSEGGHGIMRMISACVA